MRKVGVARAFPQFISELHIFSTEYWDEDSSRTTPKWLEELSSEDRFSFLRQIETSPIFEWKMNRISTGQFFSGCISYFPVAIVIGANSKHRSAYNARWYARLFWSWSATNNAFRRNLKSWSFANKNCVSASDPQHPSLLNCMAMNKNSRT